VGDAAFQDKCLGKMDEVAGEGRTVLFVSHNMAAVRHLCTRTIMLDGGTLQADGDTDEILRAYMSSVAVSTGAREWKSRDVAPHGRHQWLKGIRVVQDERCTDRVALDRPFRVEFDFINENQGGTLSCNLALLDDYGVVVLVASNNPLVNLAAEEKWFDRPHARGTYRYSCTIPGNLLNACRYFISLAVGSLRLRGEELHADRVLSFEGLDTIAVSKYPGVVRVPMEWQARKLDGPPAGTEEEEHVTA
jgi:lipopolysaccharide transport system ATP-binding protein